MGMLERIKKRSQTGFMEFISNLETTIPQSRSQIITSGFMEDPVYMTYVIKNIKSFDDFLQLSSDDIQKVITSQEQILMLFAKSLFGVELTVMNLLMQSPSPVWRKIQEEMVFLKNAAPLEIEGARYFIMKLAREFQIQEMITGFPWILPSEDVYLVKKYNDGLVKINFENGILASEGTYFKGKRIGHWNHYYPSGPKLAEGDYSAGLKFGKWIFYHQDGQMKAQGLYRNDVKQGPWKEWDQSGNLNEFIYKEGIKKEN
jgi:hypothetical protein